MAWPSGIGPSHLSRTAPPPLAAEEEDSTGLLPQVLVVCTCLQIALLLLVMHRHRCVPPDSLRRNAATKLRAGAACQVARPSRCAGPAETPLAGPRVRTGSKRGRPPDSLAPAAMHSACCALSQRQGGRYGRISRRLSKIAEGNWDVDETPTTSSAVQAKVRKGCPPVRLRVRGTDGWPAVRLGFGLGLGGRWFAQRTR